MQYKVSELDSADGRTTTTEFSDGSVVVIDHAKVYECPAGHRAVYYPQERVRACRVCGSGFVLRG